MLLGCMRMGMGMHVCVFIYYYIRCAAPQGGCQTAGMGLLCDVARHPAGDLARQRWSRVALWSSPIDVEGGA